MSDRLDRLEKFLEESTKRADAREAKLDEKLDKIAIAQARTDEQLAKTDEQLANLSKHFGGFSENEGLILEDKCYRSCKRTIQERGAIEIDGVLYDQVGRNFKAETKSLKGQYDIILFNSEIILLIDVKRKAHINDIDKLLKHKESFPLLFKRYSDFKIYLGLASDSFYDEVIDKAKESGIYLFQESAGEIEII